VERLYRGEGWSDIVLWSGCIEEKGGVTVLWSGSIEEKGGVT